METQTKHPINYFKCRDEFKELKLKNVKNTFFVYDNLCECYRVLVYFDEQFIKKIYPHFEILKK